MTDWRALLQTLPPELHLTHELGIRNAPDSIGGQNRLHLWGDGRVRVDWWEQAHSASWSARVAPEVVAEFAGHLLDAGFPALPTGPVGPGPSCRIVIGRHGDSENRCLVPVVPHEFVGPTSLAFALADSLVAQVRGPDIRGLNNQHPPLVRDVAPGPPPGDP